jgi:hypothetical protein
VNHQVLGGRVEGNEENYGFPQARFLKATIHAKTPQAKPQRRPQINCLHLPIPIDIHTDTMPIPRPSIALRAANSITAQSSRGVLACSQAQQSRALSSTSTRASGAHEDHYDPPSGWLWGIKPGEKPEKETWEYIWVYGFFGSLALGAVAYAFKPDTS